MTARQLAIAIPIVGGGALLAGVLLLLPGHREVETVSRRARPAMPTVARSSMAAPVPIASPTPAITAPALADAIRTEDAARLAAITDTYPGATTLQVARDLVAYGRRPVAIDYLGRRADGATPETWRLRVDLLHEAGRSREAEALLAAATRTRGVASAADIVWASYLLGKDELLVAAMTSGAVPPPDAALTLDLVRRAEAAGRIDRIAAIERVAGDRWRAADPWLALRVARRSGDARAELAAIDRLPASQREAAREAVLERTGDREGLRRLALTNGGEPLAIAERLLTLGFRADAIAVLARAAETLPTTARESRRLLYLLGPRPEAADRAWLRTRAARLDRPDTAGWLRAYAERDTPAAALAAVARHPSATRTDTLLLRLQLAREAGDTGAADTALAMLLDGRPLGPEELRRATALVPASADPRLVATLTRRRIDAGVAGPRDRLDLGWAALNRGDPGAAATAARAQLTGDPDDAAALRLMAEAQQRLGGATAARPWLTRLLARTPEPGRERAELLDRLGRRREALTLVAALRRDAPRNGALAALEARMLIADGRPGDAQRVLAP